MQGTFTVSYYPLNFYSFQIDTKKTLSGTKTNISSIPTQPKHFHNKTYPDSNDIDDHLRTIDHTESIDFLRIRFTPLDPHNRQPGTEGRPEICLTITGQVRMPF
jgi:hypothetical protein